MMKQPMTSCLKLHAACHGIDISGYPCPWCTQSSSVAMQAPTIRLGMSACQKKKSTPWARMQIILTLTELSEATGTATLLRMSGETITVLLNKRLTTFTCRDLAVAARLQFPAHLRNAQVRIVHDGLQLPKYRPLSTLLTKKEDQQPPFSQHKQSDWISCVFCWGPMPYHSKRGFGPNPRCPHCKDAPSWHCSRCCPENEASYNAKRGEFSMQPGQNGRFGEACVSAHGEVVYGSEGAGIAQELLVARALPFG